MKKKSLAERILSFLKTVQFNYRVFPASVARKLPVWVHYNVKVDSASKGSIQIEAPEITKAMIQLGVNRSSPEVLNWAFPKGKKDGYLRIGPDSRLIFRGPAHIAKGFSLTADDGGTIDIGAGLYANLNLFIEARRLVKIGDDCLFGWNVFLRDVDGHAVYSIGETKIRNEPKAIELGRHVWLSSETSILKGSLISEGSIVAYHAVVTGKQFQQKNLLIGGVPAQIIQENVTWKR